MKYILEGRLLTVGLKDIREISREIVASKIDRFILVTLLEHEFISREAEKIID